MRSLKLLLNVVRLATFEIQPVSWRTAVASRSDRRHLIADMGEAVREVLRRWCQGDVRLCEEQQFDIRRSQWASLDGDEAPCLWMA